MRRRTRHVIIAVAFGALIGGAILAGVMLLAWLAATCP